MTSDQTPADLRLPPAFSHSDYDPLSARDLLHDELVQRVESGFEVGDVVRAAEGVDPTDRAAVLALVDGLGGAVRRPGWRYHEPELLADIEDTLPARPEPRPVRPDTYADRVHAAWLGRIAGCNLGKPVELGWYWTPERIREYLEHAGAYPLDDYFPVLDPMPEGFELRDNWPETTRGNVDGSARDDDIDYAILALHLLEQHGAGLGPQHVAAAWTSLFPLQRVFTAERAVYVNLAGGVPLDEVAHVRNPYREWIGAQIRGDVFGYVLPGDPWAAAMLAYQDASLSHTGNGVYGEMWAAALVSSAFVSTTAREAVVTALGVVPPGSRLHEAITEVLGLHADGFGWEAALERIRARHGHYSWVHTINNAALLVAGLLWGEGDFTRTVGRTVMGGWDTDSNGATAGSVAGILHGRAGLPSRLVDPLHDRTRSALFGFDHSVISELADRTVALHRRGLD